MGDLGILRHGAGILTEPARAFGLPAEPDGAERIVDELLAAVERIDQAEPSPRAWARGAYSDQQLVSGQTFSQAIALPGELVMRRTEPIAYGLSVGPPIHCGCPGHADRQHDVGVLLLANLLAGVFGVGAPTALLAPFPARTTTLPSAS